MTSTSQLVDAVCRRLDAAGPVRVVERERTVLLFFDVDGREGRRRLVAKIKRTANSAGRLVEDDARRARREYDALVRLRRRFDACDDATLQAIRPVSFLPELGAIVMERIEGGPLYDEALSLRRLATSHGRRRAATLLEATGRWLAVLHGAQPEALAPRGTTGVGDAVTGIREEVGRLADLNVRVEWSRLFRALTELSSVSDEPPVPLHADFHLRNVHVVAGDGIVGVDTALTRQGDRHADLGKFLADLKTRRARILRRGAFPTHAMLTTLEEAFLRGYRSRARPHDPRALRLFEGWFLLRKWRRVAASLVTARARGRRLAGRVARRAAVDPTYAAIVDRWAAAVLAASGQGTKG